MGVLQTDEIFNQAPSHCDPLGPFYQIKAKT